MGMAMTKATTTGSSANTAFCALIRRIQDARGTLRFTNETDFNEARDLLEQQGNTEGNEHYAELAHRSGTLCQLKFDYREAVLTIEFLRPLAQTDAYAPA